MESKNVKIQGSPVELSHEEGTPVSRIYCAPRWQKSDRWEVKHSVDHPAAKGGACFLAAPDIPRMPKYGLDKELRGGKQALK